MKMVIYLLKIVIYPVKIVIYLLEMIIYPVKMVTEFPFGTSSNKSDSCQTHLGRYWANSSPPPHHLVTYVNKDAQKNQFLPDFSQKNWRSTEPSTKVISPSKDVFHMYYIIIYI